MFSVPEGNENMPLSALSRLDVIRNKRCARWCSIRIGLPPQVLAGLAHLSVVDFSTAIDGLEPMLTTSQLAAHLGVSPQAIYDLRHAGRGPRGLRVGRELRYRVSVVEAWLRGLEAADAGRNEADQ